MAVVFPVDKITLRQDTIWEAFFPPFSKIGRCPLFININFVFARVYQFEVKALLSTDEITFRRSIQDVIIIFLSVQRNSMEAKHCEFDFPGEKKKR